MKLKKTLFTLALDNWEPEITALTFPLMKRYAYKIGADFHVISERKFPGWPAGCEKLQIYDLGREMQNDWNFYIDADALIHPDMFDVTAQLNKDTVCFNGRDFAGIRWRYNEFFLRDGRNIGACNWFVVASDWCLDLWHPPTVSYDEAIDSIFPTENEINTVVTRSHLMDDYLLSYNIARFGLKVTTAMDIFQKECNATYSIFHQYTLPPEAKVVEMRKCLRDWKITDEVMKGWETK
jgi:hypothetical protein